MWSHVAAVCSVGGSIRLPLPLSLQLPLFHLLLLLLRSFTDVLLKISLLCFGPFHLGFLPLTQFKVTDRYT